MIETSLVEFLAAQTELQALLGEATRERIYPLIIPGNGRTPCLVYTWTKPEVDRTLCGVSGLRQARVQLSAYSPAYLTALAVTEAVRLVLSDFRGMMGETRVKDFALEAERDLEEPEPGLYRRWQDWSVWYIE